MADQKGQKEGGESKLGGSATGAKGSISDALRQPSALESPLRRMAHGLPDWLDRAMSNRTKRLKALGNSVVPDCAEWIGRQILAFAESEKRASGEETSDPSI
jgi:hypothetical protein